MTCRHGSCKIINTFGSETLYKCDECKVIFVERALEPFDPKKLYENYYYYRNELGGRFGPFVEFVIRGFRFFRAFKIFTIAPRSKRILDIGSGRGFMLYYLKKYYGYKRTVGTQISSNAYEFSKNRLGLEIYDKDLLDLPFEKNSFDIITMLHVLEHLTDPQAYLERVRWLLNDGGKLVIEVPNFSSWSSRLTGRYWLGLDLNYHLYFFTPESLTALLKKHNFKVGMLHTFSLEHSAFVSAQSLASLLTRSEHLFFNALQAPRFSLKAIPDMLVVLLLMPLCFLINIVLYFSKRGEVLLVIAEKA